MVEVTNEVVNMSLSTAPVEQAEPSWEMSRDWATLEICRSSLLPTPMQNDGVSTAPNGKHVAGGTAPNAPEDFLGRTIHFAPIAAVVPQNAAIITHRKDVG